jgi:protein tyrosine/serine phosphatase
VKKLLLLLFIYPALLYSQMSVKIDSVGLENMYRIDEGIYRSEQPDEAQFVALKKYGICEVLNLRYRHSDQKYAKKTNLILHQVRMNAHRIKDKDVINALKIIKNRKGAILIHCMHGSDRTGLIIAMYRIVFQNISKDKAIAEMKSDEYGFHNIYVNIIEYIKKADVEYIRHSVK